MEKAKVVVQILKDQDRKSLRQIFKEVIHSYWLEKEIPYHYFIELLYKDKTRDYKKYISHQKLSKVYNKYNSSGGFEDLENKVRFSELLESNQVPTPKTLAHSWNKTLFIGDKSILIDTEDDLAKVVDLLLKESHSQSIFIKKTESHGGGHAFKFIKAKIHYKSIKELYSLLPSNDFIFQECIIQHEEVDSVYSGSINTIRINAFYDRSKGELNILSALMRYGSGGSVIDNASQGGFFVPVNTETWKMEGIGRSFLKYGGAIFKVHPDTGHQLDGTEIPFGNQIYEIVKQAAPLFSKDLIGWDIAITKDGPVIVEGNHNLHLGMAQMAYGGFKGNKEYEKLLRE